MSILLFVINAKASRKPFNPFYHQIELPSMTFYSDEQKEDLKHDPKQAEQIVFQWKCHILRSKNQDKAKNHVLSTLDKASALTVMDWAMKFTQMKYREKQSEWYGKRGMNWHVSCVISKNDKDDNLEIKSYSHLFDSCAQDCLAVCAILEHLLKTIKEEKPHITKVYLRSDGAGCYNNNTVIAAAVGIGKKVGIKVMRYVVIYVISREYNRGYFSSLNEIRLQVPYTVKSATLLARALDDTLMSLLDLFYDIPLNYSQYSNLKN